MDLKMYYQKIRDMASTVEEPFPVLVSHETADGGKDGIRTEVTLVVAAKMIVEGTARLASAGEADDFRKQQAEAQQVAEQAAAAARVQFSLLSTDELKRLKGARHSKG